MTGLHCQSYQSSPYLLRQATVHAVAVMLRHLVFQLPAHQQVQEQLGLQQLCHSQRQ
jgi:hypothetical protein